MEVLRILVIEDEAVVAMLLGEVLAGIGHDVCAIVATEADAVAAAVRCKPDFMVVDARLGDGSGIAAVDEILRAGPVPHLFISGDPSNVRRLRPGAVVVGKPFSEAELVHAIQRALDAAGTSIAAISS